MSMSIRWADIGNTYAEGAYTKYVYSAGTYTRNIYTCVGSTVIGASSISIVKCSKVYLQFFSTLKVQNIGLEILIGAQKNDYDYTGFYRHIEVHV